MPRFLHVIAACAENRVIGREGKLPWQIPEDMRFFHEQTAGRVCVLGRASFEAWPRATLDGRRPVVLTSRPLLAKNAGGRSLLAGDAECRQRTNPENRLQAGSCMDEGKFAETDPIVVPSLHDALAIAERLPGEICICGGQRVFEETLALDRPLRLHLTLVHATIPGDTFFPEWRHLAWRESARRESADAGFRYTFLTLERLFAPPVFAPQKP